MKRKYIKPQTISVAIQAEGWLMQASDGTTNRNTNGNPPEISGNIESSSGGNWNQGNGQGPNGGTRARGYSAWTNWDD